MHLQPKKKLGNWKFNSSGADAGREAAACCTVPLKPHLRTWLQICFLSFQKTVCRKPHMALAFSESARGRQVQALHTSTHTRSPRPRQAHLPPTDNCCFNFSALYPFPGFFSTGPGAWHPWLAVDRWMNRSPCAEYSFLNLVIPEVQGSDTPGEAPSCSVPSTSPLTWHCSPSQPCSPTWRHFLREPHC